MLMYLLIPYGIYSKHTYTKHIFTGIFLTSFAIMITYFRNYNIFLSFSNNMSNYVINYLIMFNKIFTFSYQATIIFSYLYMKYKSKLLLEINNDLNEYYANNGVKYKYFNNSFKFLIFIFVSRYFTIIIIYLLYYQDLKNNVISNMKNVHYN